jgi:hypothetical protein
MAKLSLLFLGATHIPGIGKATICSNGHYCLRDFNINSRMAASSSLMAEYSLLKLLVLGGLIAVSIVAATGLLYHLAVKPKAKM